MNLDQFTKELGKHGETDRFFDAARFEIDCIQLLGRCDHQLQQLETVNERDRKVCVLAAGRTILVELVEFIIEQFGADRVSVELPRIRAMRDKLKQRIDELKPETLTSKPAFGEIITIGETELNEISSQLLTLCADLLLSIDAHHTDELRTARWVAGRSEFIKDFQSIW